MYDAIIVGARCAGAATAMLLARQGARVLLVDRATFPSDTISGHCVLHPGVAALDRWGLLDNVLKTGSPPVARITADFGDFALSAPVATPDGLPAAIGPRRVVMDKVLIDVALTDGVELREEFTVTDVLTDGERVTGVRGHTRRGQAIEERARIVIGADGRHSPVARMVGAAEYRTHPSLSCYYIAYWAGVPLDALEIHWRHRRIVLAIPTDAGLTMIAVSWPHD